MIESLTSLSVNPAVTGELEMSSVASAQKPTEAAGADFGQLLGNLFASTADNVKKAEAVSVAGIKGQATVQQVVEAVMNAEQSLQGAIAVRDKVVTAYLEISRMQI
ncbi:MAG: flagellar hook-basal body complex protein FliE [Hyphomicrobiaceae bacterium]|nr:flagellar hook-basal body complex protein FliE [Hyphomicrobiaceae bacterium]